MFKMDKLKDRYIKTLTVYATRYHDLAYYVFFP
jgi:hypothetical protein